MTEDIFDFLVIGSGPSGAADAVARFVDLRRHAQLIAQAVEHVEPRKSGADHNGVEVCAIGVV